MLTADRFVRSGKVRDLYDLPDGRLLVTQKAGTLVIVGANGQTLSAPIAGVPAVDASGQGGLLDVALDPQFAANRRVYLASTQIPTVFLDSSLRIRILGAAGECWSELPVDLPGTAPFQAWLFIDGDIVELFIDDRYSLAERLPATREPVQLSTESNAIISMRCSEWLLGK